MTDCNEAHIHAVRLTVDPAGDHPEDDWCAALDLLTDLSVAMDYSLGHVLEQVVGHYQVSLDDKAKGIGIWHPGLTNQGERQ